MLDLIKQHIIWFCIGGGVVALIAAACMWTTGCSSPSVLTPRTGPGTDWPCGTHGVTCSYDGKRAACCSEGDICGASFASPGSPSCPPGMCCFTGEDWMLGHHPNHLQTNLE